MRMESAVTAVLQTLIKSLPPPLPPPGDNGGTGDTSSGGENPSGGEDSKGESASSILDKRLAELEEIIRSYREA